MLEIFDSIRPIISGLIGALCVYLMMRFTKADAPVRGKVKVLEYSKGFKIFTILLVPFSIFVAYAASQARDSQIILAAVIAFCFLAGAVFFSYQVFFVKFSYDNDYVYYKSPKTGSVKAPWSSLTDIGYSSLLQADYIVIDGVGKIWCSNMLNGYSELGEFLEKKINELFPESET